MKSIVKFLASGVFAASFTLAAHATAISGSIAGNDNNATYNNTASIVVGGQTVDLLTFGNPGTVSGTPVGLGGYFHDLDTMTFYAGPGPGGSFFYSPTAGTTLTVAGSTATSGGAEVFSVTNTTANETLAFYVTSDTTAYDPADNTSLVINGTGYLPRPAPCLHRDRQHLPPERHPVRRNVQLRRQRHHRADARAEQPDAAWHWPRQRCWHGHPQASLDRLTATR